MPSWRNRPRRPFVCLLAVASVLYPGLVYVGQNRVSPLTFVAIVLVLVGLRLATADRSTSGPWRFPFVVAAVGVALLAFLDRELAVRAYPVLVSLGIAALFGYSLFRPPSAIERMARLREPDLPPHGVVYCWWVTLVWTLFALVNAGISWGTAVWGTLEMWTLWTGLLSYICLGMLFVGELMVRSVVRGRRR